MGRILVIRGGALGDFILTLPVIRLLREAFPKAHLEVLGYQQFVRLAEAGGLVDATRSIEYGRLAPFFARQTILDPDLMAYFGSFNVVVSYLFDPDGHFEKNLERSKVKTLLQGIHKPAEGQGHASLQLAQPLESLALYPNEANTPEKLEIPSARKATPSARTLALHPGSGSAAKNWPIARWIEFATTSIDRKLADQVLLLTGEVEASTGVNTTLRAGLEDKVPLSHLDHRPLTEVACALTQCHAFLGNDSGISHLAGALGVPTLALFGPTDPAVWSPWGRAVLALRSETQAIEDIEVSTVLEAFSSM